MRLEKVHLKNYINKNLISELIDDVKRYRIFSEADLQYYTRFHLEKFVDVDDTLRVRSIYSVISSKKNPVAIYPDLVILRDKSERPSPRLAIELKELRSLRRYAVTRDVEKLERLRKDLKIKGFKGFLIYLCRDKRRSEKELQNLAKEWIGEKGGHVSILIINAYEHLPSKEYKLFDGRWKVHSKYRYRQ